MVESGVFEIYVSKGGAPAVNVNDPKRAGQCFGELALMYGRHHHQKQTHSFFFFYLLSFSSVCVCVCVHRVHRV